MTAHEVIDQLQSNGWMPDSASPVAYIQQYMANNAFPAACATWERVERGRYRCLKAKAVPVRETTTAVPIRPTAGFVAGTQLIQVEPEIRITLRHVLTSNEYTVPYGARVRVLDVAETGTLVEPLNGQGVYFLRGTTCWQNAEVETPKVGEPAATDRSTRTPRPTIERSMTASYRGRTITVTAAELRGRRISMGLSQYDLAAKLGISQADISRQERGRRITIEPHALHAWCRLLRLRP